MIRIAFCQTNRLFILLKRAEKEIHFSMTNGMFKIKMDIDRHGPRRMPDNCKNLNPPYFSLPSTFKSSVKLKKRGVGKEEGMGHCSRWQSMSVFFILPSSGIGTEITYYWASLNRDGDTSNKRRRQNGKHKPQSQRSRYLTFFIKFHFHSPHPFLILHYI